MSRSPAYLSGVSLLVSFHFFYPQRASYIHNYRSCLPVQISEEPGYPSSYSILFSFYYFYSLKALFPLICRSSLPVQISRKSGYPSNFGKFLLFLFTELRFLINCRSFFNKFRYLNPILDGVRAYPILDGGAKKPPRVNSAIWCLTTMKFGRNVV